MLKRLWKPRSLISIAILGVFSMAMIWHLELYLVALMLMLSLASVIFTALFADKNKYRIKADYQYQLANHHGVCLALGMQAHGFCWPKTQDEYDTAWLKVKVKSNFCGYIQDPAITLMFAKQQSIQYFARGCAGIRYINVSEILAEKPQAEDFIHLKSRHLSLDLKTAELVLYKNPKVAQSRTLVIAPHPDDAEIAAFGLYSSCPDSYILTLTAGDSTANNLQAVIKQPQQRQLMKGKLRVFDSLTVPLWGGLDSQRLISLGYADGSLATMYQAPAVEVNPEWTQRMHSYRQFNRSTLCPGRAAAGPDVASWNNLCSEIEMIIAKIKPDIIVTPHLQLDKHLDHQYASLAILQSLKNLDFQQGHLYFYVNHNATARNYPFGPAHSAVGLPPNTDKRITSSSIYSHNLNKTQQTNKIFALEAMHDLRLGPRQRFSLWRDWRYQLAGMINGRHLNRYGYDSFYWRAIKSNELFFVEPFSAVPNLLASAQIALQASVVKLLQQPTANLCSDKSIIKQILALQGQVFRDMPGRKTLRFLSQGQAYFAKLHYGVGWVEIFKNLIHLRLPIVSASNEWRAIQRCQKVGIPTAELSAYGCYGWNPATLHSFIITKELTEVISLEDYCKTWSKRKPNFKLKRALIKAVAKLAFKLHRSGMNHRDFYICHLLLDLKYLADNYDSSGDIRLYLLDLHRVQIRQKVGLRWLVKDIGGLYCSVMNLKLTHGDLYYFMKHYSGCSVRQCLTQHQEFWRKVVRRAEILYENYDE